MVNYVNNVADFLSNGLVNTVEYIKQISGIDKVHGIIGGMTDGTLNPCGTATRAQMAAILQRFMEVMNR